MEKISFVIPVYNSEKSIEKVIDKIEELVNIELDGQYEYEVILANDGSRDKSECVCKEICKRNEYVKFLNLSRNFGQHSAILAAFNYVTGDYIVNLDDDLQTDPLQVGSMLKKLKQENYDIVYAKYAQKKHSFGRNIGTKVNSYMSEQMMGKPKDISIGSFYIAKRYVINEVIKYQGPFPYVSGLLLRVTRNVANIEIIHKERAFGSSNYNFSKLLALWINGFTNFSIKPIRIVTLLGGIVSSVGCIGIVGDIILKLFNNNYSIKNSIMFYILLLVMGIQFIAMGIVGEYVGRIFILLNNAPQYIVKESCNLEEKDTIEV